MPLLCVSFSLIVLPCLCLAKNVIMFPPPMTSYIIYHANIGQALQQLGHNVSLCVPEYLASKGLVPHKSLNIIKYGDHLGDVEETFFKNVDLIGQFWEGKTQTILSRFPIINMFKKLISDILSDSNFLSDIRDKKPDFFILDNYMYTRNIIVLPYKLGIPFGLIGTFHDYFLNRIPFNPAMETVLYEKASNKKTFFERVNAVLMTIMYLSYDMFTDNDIVSRYAPERAYTTIGEIALNAEIYITESDYILDYPRTSLPNTKLVGGSSVREAKPLSEDLKSFVDGSSNGIALVAFGGHDIYLPEHIKYKMAAAFRKLDLNIVWKVNWTSDQPDKILALTWIPQNDLLGHPKTKVFISHCGKNGQYEALYHGVPMICLPIFGDQFYNSQRISVKELGVWADIREITSEEFIQLIQQVDEDPKYRTNIQKASKIFKELYKIPSKEAAFWFDHVMRYGGSYMRSSGQQMPLYQFLLLDVIAYLLVILIVILFALYVLFRLSCSGLKKMKVKRD